MKRNQRGFAMAAMMIAMVVVLFATSRHHGMMGMGHGDGHERTSGPAEPKPQAPPVESKEPGSHQH